MKRLWPLAPVKSYDVVGNVRTHSKPIVPFGDFNPSFCSDLGVHPWIVTGGCHLALNENLL